MSLLSSVRHFSPRGAFLLSRGYHGIGEPKFDPSRPVQATQVSWLESSNFAATDETGKIVTISAGEGPGVSPMKLVLMALGGCASVDVVNIMKKQRQGLTDMKVQVEGQRSTEGARPYESIHMRWIAKGTDLDKVKIEHAVKLSTEKYCGVHASLAVPIITFSVEIDAGNQ